MLMLGIATILQRLKDICFKVLSIVMELTHKLHLKTIGAYLIDQMTQFATLIANQYAIMLPKVKVWLAHCLIIVVLSTKAGLIRVAQILGVLGTKLVTIAHKTLQRVKALLKLDK